MTLAQIRANLEPITLLSREQFKRKGGRPHYLVRHYRLILYRSRGLFLEDYFPLFNVRPNDISG